MANKKIQLSSLEFDSIKQNLKTFLQGQERFSDYDFEGSNMAVLLDVLAYNTHYNAMYMNMAINEAFLDSASKRNSVVSLAKSIGYLPRSATCGKTNVFFTVTETSTEPEFMTIDRYATFQGVKDGTRYSFYTTEAITSKKNELKYGVAPQGTFYQFPDILLLEGSPVSNIFEYSQSNVYQISNRNADLSTLRVTVRDSASSSSYKVYTNGNHLANLDGSSLVYFIKEVDNGFYEINFGEGVIGKPLEPGNLITIEYFVSSGVVVNGIKNLSYVGQPLLGGVVSNLIMETAVNSAADPEDTELIRNNAPSMWQAQNRAVTEEDYRVILLNKAPEIKDVIVWGGQKNIPPIYGKVFICATSSSDKPISLAVQEQLKSTILDQFKMVTAIPEFVDPEYLDVELDVVVYYDPSLTNKTISTLQTDLINSYGIYNDLELKKFGSIIRNSELVDVSLSTDKSIVNVIPRLRVSKSIVPFIGVVSSYDIRMGNPIDDSNGSVFSTGFTPSDISQTCYIESRENGSMVMYYLLNGAKTDVRQVGTVNFSNGLISIKNLNIISAIGDNITFKINPNSGDIVGLNNQIARLDLDNLKVSIIADDGTKSNYKFTNTRL